MAVMDYAVAVAGLAVVVFGLTFVLTGVQHFLEGRRISSEELTPVGEVEPGPVTVSGTARPVDDVLPAPFSDRDCLAADYELREAQGKNQQTPTALLDETNSVPFHVDDGTGQVLVEPDDADLELEREETFTVEREERPPEPVRRFLSRRDDVGEPTRPTVDAIERGIGNRYFREALLEPGEDVYVFGQATRRQAREFDETTIEIGEGAAGSHPDETTFIVADRPKEAVAGGHRSGGVMAVVLGGAICAVGVLLVLSSSLV